MNTLHPAIVHLPLGVAIVMPLLFAALTWALWTGRLGRRGFLLGALLQAAILAGGLVALRTGGADEERVESVVPEAAIERHELLAQVFTGAAGLTFLLALGVALLPDRAAKKLALAATVASVGVVGLGVAVGHAGGQLVYQHGAAAAYASPQGASAPAVEARADGDDD
jgi:uncharacterized membrane protein